MLTICSSCFDRSSTFSSSCCSLIFFSSLCCWSMLFCSSVTWRWNNASEINTRLANNFKTFTLIQSNTNNFTSLPCSYTLHFTSQLSNNVLEYNLHWCVQICYQSTFLEQINWPANTQQFAGICFLQLPPFRHNVHSLSVTPQLASQPLHFPFLLLVKQALSVMFLGVAARLSDPVELVRQLIPLLCVLEIEFV